MIDERSVNRCKHFKSNGEQCKNNAMTGRRFCYITSHCGDAPISARAASLFQSKWRETIISLFFGILVATIVFAYQENEYRHGVLFGTLLGRKDSLKEPSIILGNARIGVTGANTNLFEDSDGSPLISLRIDDKGYLKTSVNLRNRSGTLVAEMKDNEWQVSAPQIFDRNFNDQVLEIRDPWERSHCKLLTTEMQFWSAEPSIARAAMPWYSTLTRTVRARSIWFLRRIVHLYRIFNPYATTRAIFTSVIARENQTLRESR